jgi:alanine dehydrogenase
MTDVLKYVEEAFGLYGKYEAGQNAANFSPMVSFPTKVPHTDIDYRAGTIDPIESACTTLGFGYWDNPSNHGLPSVFAYAFLSELATGKPLAFMEGYYVGAMRTGAAGAVASKRLAKKHPHMLGLIGTGSVAKYMLWAHLEQFGKFEQIRAWSRTPARRDEFAKLMKQRFQANVSAVPNPRDAVEGADIVCCCTPSREPIVMDEWVKPGTHINAFGADAPGKQELDPQILKRSKIAVDSLAQCKIGGEIHKALAAGLIRESDVHGSLGEIVNGWKGGRTDDLEVTVMDSTGLSAVDVVCFHRTFEKAVAKGLGTRLELGF